MSIGISIGMSMTTYLLTWKLGMCIGTSLYKHFLSGIRVWRSCVVFQEACSSSCGACFAILWICLSYGGAPWETGWQLPEQEEVQNGSEHQGFFHHLRSSKFSFSVILGIHYSLSQPQFFGLQIYVMFFWCLVRCLRTEPLRFFPLLGTFFLLPFL